jgi:hypothetical protein
MKLVTHGLIDKRAEIVGRIEAHRDSLDRSIRIFEPDIDLGDLRIKPVPPPNAAFRGEVARFLLHTLRQADIAMKTHEMGFKVMQSRGLNTADKGLAKLISQRTGHSLGMLRKRGFVMSERVGSGSLLRWTLSRKGEAGDPQGGWRNGASVA